MPLVQAWSVDSKEMVMFDEPLLLPTALAIKETASRIFESEKTLGRIVIQDPEEQSAIKAELAQIVPAEIWLPDGTELYELTPGQKAASYQVPLAETPISTRFSANVRTTAKYRVAPDTQPRQILEFPGEEDWFANVCVAQRYDGEPGIPVSIYYMLYENSEHPGTLPAIARTVGDGTGEMGGDGLFDVDAPVERPAVYSFLALAERILAQEA
jgi:hypothetical protein